MVRVDVVVVVVERESAVANLVWLRKQMLMR